MFLASGYILIYEAFEDTTLQIPNPVGKEGSKTVPVPKGTQVDILSALHRLQLTVDMIGKHKILSQMSFF